MRPYVERFDREPFAGLVRLTGMDPDAMTDDELVDEFLREHPGADDRMRLALWLGRKVTPEDWPDRAHGKADSATIDG